MSDSFDDLLSTIRKLEGVQEETARLAVPLVLAAAKKTADAGTTPYGVAWEPKKGGGRALEKASGAITCEAYGPTIRVTLTGVNVLQNFGTKRIPAREIIPSRVSELPPSYEDAIRTAFGQAVDKLTGGR